MNTPNDTEQAAFNLSYALAKQLGTAHTMSSIYGDLPLDDELRTAIERAVRPILQARLDALENTREEQP